MLAEDQVGLCNTAIITSDNPNAVIARLIENDVSGLGARLIVPYVNVGAFFVALLLAKDRDIGDIQPIALTYETDSTSISIKLIAVATEFSLGVRASILSQDRAVLSNYLHVKINEARIDCLNDGFNYPDVVTEAVNEAGGNAFATDYAGASGIMTNLIYREGHYDLFTLRSMTDPTTFLEDLLRQGFPQDAQMQSLIRRNIQIPQLVLERSQSSVSLLCLRPQKDPGFSRTAPQSDFRQDKVR